jgi:uncharacterized damage-inducible protein DinB
MKSLISISDRLLGQAVSLIREHSADEFTRCCPVVFSSSIGQHIRHCVEHYEEFLHAVNEQREIDYERRPRDPNVETDPAEAVARIEKIRAVLRSPSLECHELRVWDNGSLAAARSSVSREIQFLLSHTVHHFALIVSLGGRQVPDNFGMAPSTLKHRESA